MVTTNREITRRLREPVGARLVFRITREQERMITAMCASEKRTVADILRILIEEGAERRGYGYMPTDLGRGVAIHSADNAGPA